MPLQICLSYHDVIKRTCVYCKISNKYKGCAFSNKKFSLKADNRDNDWKYFPTNCINYHDDCQADWKTPIALKWTGDLLQISDGESATHTGVHRDGELENPSQDLQKNHYSAQTP